MKKLMFPSFLFCLFLTTAFFANKVEAQTNTGIFFQAVARDVYSNPAKDRKIYIQSSIIQNSPTGTKVLVEEHQSQTDATGVFSISVGQGSRKEGTAANLTAIEWAKGPYYLNLKISIVPIAPAANWDYTKEWLDIGTTPFGTVPYALYSGSSGALDSKLNVSDTAKMLALYAKAQTVQSLSTAVATKISTNDTSAMLAPYKAAVNALVASNITSLTAAAINSALDSKLNIADSITMYVTPTQLAAKTFDSTSIYNQLALKANSTDVTNSLNTKENTSNKSTSITTDAASDTKYPSVKSVKTYVDTQVAGATIADADATTKGKIQLAGDLTGTAASPSIANSAVTTAKINDAAVTDAKIATVSASKVTGDITGKASNITGNLALTNGGTGATTAAGARSNLGLVIGTDVQAPLSFTTPLQKNTNTVSINQATPSVDGYLSASDFTNFNNKISATEKATNNGVATLGNDGKIPSNQIPAISFQSAVVVSSQPAMLALSSAVVGSIAIRTDVNKNFVLSATPASTLANWIELATPNSVTSVNGYAGPNVVLTTNDVSEGSTNKYYTDARVRGALSVASPLSFNTSTGTFSMSVASGSSNGYLSSSDFTTFNNKQNAMTAGVDYLAPNGSASALSNFPTLNQNTTGNAATATKLSATKNINGVAFDGSTDITVAANAGTLTGTSLANTITGSSLTSVGTITTGVWSGTTIAIAKGGTGATTASGALTNLGAEPTANKSTATDLGSTNPSDILFPSQKAVKTYVDQQSANAGVADLSITNAKLAGSITAAKLVGTDINTVGTITTGVWSGTTIAIEKGGTGATTASAARTNLGLVIGTNVLAPNASITGATKTKITYDANGLVTAGADATTADIAPSTNRNYVTDLQSGVLSNTSGVNTGDETTSSIKTKLGISTLSGSNTGDQTISLTGDIAGSGTGSFATTVNSVGGVSSNTIASLPTTVSSHTSSITSLDTRITSNTNSITSNTSSIATINTTLGTKADLASPVLTGVPTAPTPATNDNSTTLATTAYVKASITAANAGVSSVGAISGTSNANGATISGSTQLILTPADANFGGVVTTATQTFAGAKTFSNTATFNTDISVNGLTVGKGGGNNIANTAIGSGALALNTSGSGSTAFGYKALSKSTAGNATAFGTSALENLTTGTSNVAIGYTALNQTSTQNSNTAVGDQAMRMSTGANNTALGASALYGVAGQTNGNNNTAIGNFALKNATTAAFNVGVGSNSLNNITSGNDNTVLGYQSGYLFGAGTGANLTNMSQGVLIGSNVRTGTNTSTNEIAIGYNVLGNGSNTVTIGNNSITANYFKGDINLTGNVNGGTWSGTVIGSNYGGAGTVNGLMKANGSGVVSAAVAGTDYLIPSGNIATATALATGRTISTAGDVTYTSGTFDGSANVTGTATLTNTTVTAGTYGSSTAIPTFTVDSKGRLTAASTVGIIAGVSTLNYTSTTSYANGGTISGTSLTLTPADATNPGLISTGAQTIAGAKTFNSDVTAPNFLGNATTATSLAIGRTISTIGDVTYTSGSFDGSANVTGVATLTNTTVTAGTYGSSTAIPTFTVDSKGRLTAASTVGITAGVSSLNYTSTTSFANGGTISGTSLTLAAADATNPGLISTGVQTIAGAKTFNSDVTAPNFLGNATTATTAGNITATSNTTLTSLANLATVGNITAGTWSATEIAIAKGGTGATTASGARTNLGLGSIATKSAIADADVDASAAIAFSKLNITKSNITGLGIQESLTAGSGISISAGTISATGLTTSNLASNAAIANAQLANSTTTLGSTTMTLGGTVTSVTGLTSVSSSGFIGALTGNSSTATKLASTKNINGVPFDGSADVTVAADANTLTGTTLASNVVNSNLTSVGTITSGVWSGTAIANNKLANSSTTLGSTSMILGGTVTSVTGLTSLSATTVVGNLSGTATTATNIAGGLIGSIPYQTAAGTTALLAGNTTSTVKYLTSSGDGTNSTAPVWATPSFVPYSGATGAVDLGSYDLKVNGLTIGVGNNGKSVSSFNTSLGASALSGNNSGVGANTAIGFWTLKANTTGAYNTGIGFYALNANTTGTDNSAVGYNALVLNTGSYNTSVGSNALSANTSGQRNAAFGYGANQTNSTGNNNSAFGYGAISSATASDNTAIGYTAGNAISTGAKNIFIGSQAGNYAGSGISTSNTTGLNSVMIGYDVRPLANADDNEIVISGYNSSAGTVGLGSNSTLIGSTTTQKSQIYGALTVVPNTATGAGNSSTIEAQAGGTGAAGGSLNLKAGNGNGAGNGGNINLTPGTTGTGTAGKVIVNGGDMTVNGVTVGKGTGNGTTNTAVGTDALLSNTGGDNTAVGWRSLYSNTSGASNSAFGTGTMVANTTGKYNTALGYNTLYMNNANHNTGIGYNTMYYNDAGIYNTAVGGWSAYYNQSGNNNTSLGYRSLYANTATSSSDNTAIGYSALSSNASGGTNTALGSNAGLSITTGAGNTGVGYRALYYNTTGSNNTALGNSSGPANSTNISTNGIFIGYNTRSSAGTSITDETVIGANTTGNGSNTVTIGNAANTANYLRGTVNVNSGTSTATQAVNVVGSVNDFLEFNIQNNSSGTGAQSGINAMANNGTDAINFAWMGINSSTFNNPQTYNIGGANDVSFLGAGNDMYVANASNTKSIIFSTGTATTPYFSERMRITATGNVGIGTNSPTANLEVTGTTKLVGAATFSSTVSIPTGAAAGKVLTSDASGGATWQNSGGSVVTMSATGTATSTATYIIFTGSTASQIITIPSAVTMGSGREITIKNVASVSVSIASAGGYLIQDNSTLTSISASLGIEPSNNWMKLVSDGTNWYIFRALF